MEAAGRGGEAGVKERNLTVGIDASNLRAGGGLTHIVELLRHAEPEASGIGSVVVWAAPRELAALPDRPWLTKRTHALLRIGRGFRLAWQASGALRGSAARHDVMFAPGGTHFGRGAPVVAMSQNLLPFDPDSSSLYGFSFTRLRLSALRALQARTFRTARGVVFLTRTAARIVRTDAGRIAHRQRVITHGVADRFRMMPRPARDVSDCTAARPFRWLYVSIIAPYKHQWNVLAAVANLRQRGLHARVDFVGPADSRALRRLRGAMERFDPKGEFSTYHGPISHADLHATYRDADGFVFASSCENLPIIMLEAMAAGLPIVSSDRGVMPEMLGGAGVLFDPFSVRSLTDRLGWMMVNREERARLAQLAYERGTLLDWSTCARQTFDFLAECARAGRA
jgi:glycosyltransferase involved in cell wall biosynthesis